MLRINGGQFVQSRLRCVIRSVVNLSIAIKRDIHNKSTPLSDFSRVIGALYDDPNLLSGKSLITAKLA